MPLDSEPLVFQNEEELNDYMAHPKYELDDAHPGICWALAISDNLDTYRKTDEAPRVEVKYHTEVRTGRSPSQMRREGENKTMQQMFPSTNNYPDE